MVQKQPGKVADFAISKLALLWETATWKLKGRSEGWLSVTADGLGGKEALPAADLQTLSQSGRNLLFLHGTFSGTQGAFRSLARTQGGNGKTFFEDPGTVDFLVRALRGQAQPAQPIDVDHDLPPGRRRGTARTEERAAAASAEREGQAQTVPML